MPISNPAQLEERLNDFDPRVRRDALEALQLLARRQIPVRAGTHVNMHCHSFFSYHANGWSPTRIAWACCREGVAAAALCDFDVLDGLEEFLRAGLTLGLRTAVHLETRAFLAEYARQEIHAPGEPGVSYIMGAGFISKPADDTPQGTTLAGFRESARARNEALIARLNAKLPAIGILYLQDVLPLTPLGVACERHIIRAYAAKARRVFPDDGVRAALWAPLLRCKPGECETLENDETRFEEALRTALTKRGGIGYVPPDANTFPPVETFIAWVRACDAIPTITWLDGTSDGEADGRAMLGLLRDKGCAALNIIPDRTWNSSQPQERDRKTANLREIVQAATDLQLPINFGTELNRVGLPLADDLSGPLLREHRDAFRQGAHVMIGHTLLSRYANAPYLGPRATAEFPELRARNRFYAAIGALPPVTHEIADTYLDAGPERAFALLADATRTGHHHE